VIFGVYDRFKNKGFWTIMSLVMFRNRQVYGDDLRALEVNERLKDIRVQE
jgi:hypothetical protein